MNINKAIELLSDSANRGMTTFSPDYKAAQLLGIEALKAWKEMRRSWRRPASVILPGETE